MSTAPQELRTDICLIGAGPIGIEMAIALKAAGLAYMHFEAGSLASTIAWYSPGTSIFSSPERLAVAGMPFSVYPHSKATREDYLAYLRDAAHQKQLAVMTHSRVVSAQRAGNGTFCCEVQHSLHGVGGPAEPSCAEFPVERAMLRYRVTCRRIILAIGNMHLANRLGIAGEDLPHVSHFLGEVHDYTTQRVIVVGGKNSAVEAGIRLALAHARVDLCYRREELDPTRIKPWLLPHFRSLQREGRIEFRNLLTPLEISAETMKFRHANGEAVALKCDRVLLLTGYTQRCELFKQLGVELHGTSQAPRHDVFSMQTNVPGVFVAGTASVGTQISGSKAFIETTHVDVERILKALGVPPVASQTETDRPMRPEVDWES